MRLRQSYFLHEKIEASTEMEKAWIWATPVERTSIKDYVLSSTQTALGDEYRWCFELRPRNPKVKKCEAKDRVLTCVRGMPPTFRGMKRLDILKLVAPAMNTVVDLKRLKKRIETKTVKLLPTKKKRKRKTTIIW